MKYGDNEQYPKSNVLVENIKQEQIKQRPLQKLDIHVRLGSITFKCRVEGHSD